jgi:hypothetical protein
MAFRHGKTASLSVAGTVLQAYLDSAALNVTNETADTTAFGSTWTSAIAGLLGGTLSGSGFYDPTTSTGPQAVLWTAFTGGATVAFIYYPGGNTTNQRSYSFSGLVTSMEESATVSDKVTFSFEVLVSGAVTPATI